MPYVNKDPPAIDTFWVNGEGPVVLDRAEIHLRMREYYQTFSDELIHYANDRMTMLMFSCCHRI